GSASLRPPRRYTILSEKVLSHALEEDTRSILSRAYERNSNIPFYRGDRLSGRKRKRAAFKLCQPRNCSSSSSSGAE
ncbi:hypothetical protein TSAR_013980, partial [Trichomalopsis sarcophagae]